MNNVKLLGRLTANPELRYSANGRAYTQVTVAVPRQNDRDQADFVRCAVFDKLAEALARNCGKGRQLLVDGRLEVSTKDDPTTNQRRYFTTVIAHHIDFLHDPSYVGRPTPGFAPATANRPYQAPTTNQQYSRAV
ncbi:single-stranded DNA-binding protein (plasmid) [Limosilactobacillus fermentum]|uniref:single-stranded DNA-binding protein n=1 Tax=Limosilactobacillus fermentum TaxID=1613 RepID=UPI00331333CE